MGVVLSMPNGGSELEGCGTPNVYEAARKLIMMQDI